MQERGLDQVRLDVLRQQVVDEQRPGLLALGHLVALRAHRGAERLDVAVREDVDPRAVADRAGQRLAPPGGGEVELARRSRPPRPPHADERLAAARDVLVVGVRLVPLEHRELGVVLERDALVAEVLAELVDALEAADDQPLQVQLGGDPQVEVAVELVVVGDERPRGRAAVERLQDRRLDLDEARVVEEAADRGDHLRAGDEDRARLLVGDQVELAVAMAGLDVGEAVVLVGRRAAATWPAARSRRSAATARRGACGRRSRRRRSGRRGRAPAAAPSLLRRGRRPARGAASGRSGRRGRGTRPCPGRGGRPGGRRSGRARRSPRRRGALRAAP